MRLKFFSYSQSEIDAKVGKFRTQLLNELKLEEEKKSHAQIRASESVDTEHGRLIPKGTHEIAAVNMLKNSVFKDALGIGPNFEDGHSMEQANARKKEEEEARKLHEAQKLMKYVLFIQILCQLRIKLT